MGCRRHPLDKRVYHTAETDSRGPGYLCTACGVFVSRVKSLSGKRARARGNRQENELAQMTGGMRTGQFGGKDDVVTDLFAFQSKKGLVFPERLHRWLTEIPTIGDRVPVLVLMDNPDAPFKRRRALAVMHWSDWKDLHGDVE